MSFSLKLFGGVSLERAGTPLSGPVVQRHRLALLAVLAASRRPVSRDKLMALLWPDRDTEPARQLLNQAVHTIRRTLSPDTILSVGEELQFNSAEVWCDVVAFEEALAEPGLARAVGLYAGPFLDGFFLSEAPEFDRWVERERTRFAAACARSLESLATAAAQTDDAPAAVEWWKRLAAHDPYDSRIALQLMQALVGAGNRAGALQHGLTHQRLLREELEIEPAPEVLALVERLRHEPAALATSRPPLPGPAPVAATMPEPVLERPSPPGRRRTLVAALTVLALAATWAATRMLQSRESLPAGTTPAVVDEIAQAVARELRRREGGDTGRTPAALRTHSIAAYEFYLKGSDPAAIRSDSAARKALENFQRAVALDSSYAAAWAGVARLTYRVLGPGKAVRDQGEAAARKALALDDSLGEAHALLAVYRSMAGDTRAADYHFERAIALEPKRARTREWRSSYYLATGRPTEALAEAEQALALEPLSPTAPAEVARALIGNHRCDDALAKLKPLLALDPPPLRVAPLVAHGYACKAMWAEAMKAMEPWTRRGDLRGVAWIGYFKGRAGQTAEAQAIHADLLARWRDGKLEAYWLAWVPAALGDRDQAFSWLDRAFEKGELEFSPGLRVGLTDPLFDDLRGDPRLEALRRRLGFQRR